MERLDRVTIDPSVCLGQPTIRGMRITPGVVLKMLASGKAIEDVLEAYPELEEEDIRQVMKCDSAEKNPFCHSELVSESPCQRVEEMPKQVRHDSKVFFSAESKYVVWVVSDQIHAVPMS